MKTLVRLSAAAACLAGFLLQAPAEEKKATLKADRVNVRGGATLNSEVITQLRAGETITVLEEITVEKPGPGEPAKWARILLPSNTPVWVHASFIDPATKTVNASKLNVRAGPGENFSVVAQLKKGDAVREIRTVEEWMEIEPPAGACAFVAADFLDLSAPSQPAEPALAAKKQEAKPAEPAEPAKPKELAKLDEPKPAAPAPITTVETVTTDPAPAVATDVKPAKPMAKADPAKPATLPAAEPIVAPPPVVVPPVAAPSSAPAAKPAPAALPEPVIAPAPPAKPAVSEPPPKRVVQREGMVKRTWSIQAPTSFALVDPDTGQTINYLYTADTGLQLKYYVGQKIRVSGPESLDARWPRTPMILIETLETLP